MNPPILYHYTSLNAFQSIISTGKFRATHYRHLNGDPQEVRFGVGKLLEAVKQHKVDDSYREYKDYLIEFIELFNRDRLQVYVVSFTEKQDSQYHWHKYAPSGVAIGLYGDRAQKGFPIDITRRIGGAKVENPVRPDPANRFIWCQYIHILDLPALVTERFFAANSYPAMFGKPMVEQWFRPLLAVSIYQTICSIKQEHFANDVEYRCVHFDPDQAEYPVMFGDKDQPFIEMQFDPVEFVKEVWVGAHACRRECEAIIASFLGKGRLRCEVKRSAVAGLDMTDPNTSDADGGGSVQGG